MQRLQKKPQILVRCAGVGLMLLSSISATAAQPRKAAQQEVYPATETDVAIATTRPLQVAPSKHLERKVSAPALTFDWVPSDQIDPISKRLRLVDTLIHRHARAYDYRTHTVAELETILAKLDAAKTPALVPKQGPDEMLGGSEIPQSSDD